MERYKLFFGFIILIMVISGHLAFAQEPGNPNAPPTTGQAENLGISGGMQTSDFKQKIQTVDTISKFLESTQGYFNVVAGTIAIVFILIGASLYIISAFGNENLAKLGKKIVIVTIGGFTIVIAAPVFYKEIINIIQGQPENVATTSGMAKILSNLVMMFLGIVGMYAIIGFLFGGITYFFAMGDESRMERAKTIVRYSVIGTVIVIGAMILVTQITKLLGG